MAVTRRPAGTVRQGRWPAHPPRLLVLRALGVGDLLTAVPALRGVRAAWPGHELVLAAPSWLTPLVGLVGGVDRLHDHDGPRPLAWTGPAPDVAVNLHGRGPQSHAALAALRPARLLAFHQPGTTSAGAPRWRPGEPEVARWCRMLQAHGVGADPADLLLPRPPAPAGLAGASVLHVGAKDPARRWPPDRFVAVARAFATRGHRVVVTAGPGEQDASAAVAGAADVTDLGGRTDLGQLAALVAHARVVVCGDTGVAHLATAFAVPSVVLFGAVSPREWGPSRDRHLHRALHAARAGDDVGQALGRIGADEVVRAADALLEEAA